MNLELAVEGKIHSIQKVTRAPVINLVILLNLKYGAVNKLYYYYYY
jgi:hypothetical protein